jgi:alkanesulfonate monooxygenase SsuD/methylene tetrahydromethanopterin reductase-like flavin-dependent oxidoreductase (luciferase family)
MTTELNELLNVHDDDKAQIWIIGTRDQVIHQINEFYVKRIATDRIKFTPIIPAPFAKGKYMTVLVR